MRASAVPGTGILLAALVLGAQAQDNNLYDPSQLPAYHGQVQLFTLTPHGDIDGVVLTDGTEVKTPPHLSTELALTIRPGDVVTIHGLKAAKLPLIQAMSITNDRDQKTVVDRGPPPPPGSPSVGTADERTVSGQVRMVLHGPRGEVNGVLLTDGTILRLPPTGGNRLSDLLSPGQSVSAEGSTRVSVAGKVVEVTALGSSPEKLRPLN